MKTLFPVTVLLVFLVAGCTSSSDTPVQGEATRSELHAQRAELDRLQAAFAAERQRLGRSILQIQSHVEDLDRILNQARLEIWGDGSSTGAQLSTAQRTLASIRAEVASLARELQATGGPR